MLPTAFPPVKAEHPEDVQFFAELLNKEKKDLPINASNAGAWTLPV